MRDLVILSRSFDHRPTGSIAGLRRFIIERSNAHGVGPDAILSRDRSARLSHIRHLIMAEAYATGQWSFLTLGKGFNRDHSTVVYAVQKRRALAQQEAA